MEVYSDDRIVLTLDAGGTNFVFTAIQRGQAITKEIKEKSNAFNLQLCINTMIKGFRTLMKLIDRPPAAISFAFPGPADYPNGIIGDLPNLSGFRGGVPLKSILEEAFDLPVFINNDGDLFTFGEAIGGILPEINNNLKAAGSTKSYHNLVGLTLGTGFGGGIVRKKQLFIGDNSLAGEIHLFSNRYSPENNIEDIISTHAIQREYANLAKIEYPNSLMPKDICDIANGKKAGNQEAAMLTYQMMGRAIGDIAANLFTLIDGIIVLGGGITGAKANYMPAVMNEINKHFNLGRSEQKKRLVQKIFNLDDHTDRPAFYKDYSKILKVPGTNKTISYDPIPRLAIVTSRIGASQAIALGAYAFALEHIN